MDKYISWPQAALSALGGYAIYWMGGLDNLLTALLAMMVIDYITGIFKAVCKKTLNSVIGFTGIAKKVLMLSLVALSFIIEQLLKVPFPLREVVIMFFVSNEGLSILENSADSGLPIPKKLRDILKQLTKDENDGENDKEDGNNA